MNKNLKKTIAVALAFSAVSAAAPATSSNIFTTKVYASDNEDELSKLYLKTTDDSNIKLYDDDDYDDKVDNDEIDHGDTYYAKTSANKVKISTSGVTSKYIRVFHSSGSSISDSKKGYRTSEDISLSSGKNTIVVRVYDKAPSENPRFDNDDHKLYDYEIQVKCSGSGSSSSSSSSNGDVYLDTLSVDDKDITLSESKTTYTKTVSSSTDSVTIKAEPEDSDDYVSIDGDSIDEDDDWEKDVDLKKGKNEFKIEVEDDDDSDEVRKYTLIIYRGENTATSDNILLDSLQVGNSDITLSENKKQYNLKVNKDTDEIYIKAEPKDTDYKVTINGTEVDEDDDYEVNAQLQENKVNTFKVKVTGNGKTQEYNVNIGRGDNVTGYPSETTAATNTTTNTNTNVSVNRNKWVQIGSLWQYYDATGNAVKDTFVGNYYIGSNGYMVSNCWQKVNGDWYYFDASGAKYTGWLQSYDGKWYYLTSDGRMAHDTYISGWRVGSDGAWIK